MCFNSEWGLTALRKKSPNGKESRDRAEQRSLELAHRRLRRASSSFLPKAFVIPDLYLEA